MKSLIIHWILLIIGIKDLSKVLGNLHSDIPKKLEENGTVLSRKRRYLVFPEGSSFQVVFDLTYPSVGMGNAFVFGNTAAMGFELPSTPIFLDKKKMSKNEDDKLENKTMQKAPEHLDHQADYQNYWEPPQSFNTVHEDYEDPSATWQHRQDFTPNSVDNSFDPYGSTWTNIDRSPVTYYSNPFDRYVNQNLHQKLTPVKNLNGRTYHFANYLERNFRNNGKQPSRRLKASVPFRKTITHHIHRRSRRELYTKIEKLFTALSKDGAACILKAICQVNKIPKNKGSMWEEIMKAIFKVKPHDLYPDEDHYDKAANNDYDCDKQYPQCDGHVLGNIFRRKF